MPLDNTPSSNQPQPWEKSYPADLRWDSEIPEITMVDLFEESVKKFKDSTCLNFMGKKYSYKEVGEMADRFAKGLQDQGVGKGSKVGLCLPNTPFYVVAYYGALKAGATVVNFNPLYAEKEMENQIKDSDADVMVTVNLKQVYPKIDRVLGQANLKKIIVCDMADALSGKEAAGFRAINRLAGLPLVGKKFRSIGDKKGVQPVSKIKKDKNHLSFEKMLKSKGKLKPVEVHPDDIAVLQYTGGTTGVPKAAMLSHGNLSANTQQATLWFTGGKEREKQDKVLAVLPFFHVFSMTAQMNLSIFTGAEIVMLPKFDLKQTLETINKEKPTIFAGVPTIYKAITDYKDVGKYDLSSLDVCISGGAPLPEEIMQGFKKLTGIELVEGYGLSESSAAAIANPLNGEKKINSIGLPLPKTEVKFVALPDETTPVKYQGEICLRGPQIMKGYWKRPDETEAVMDKDGFLHTGDVGYMDKDGYIFINGRTKDMIIASGLKVFPRKVEEAILKNDAVSDVSVIGVSDPYRGETVKAFIVLKEGKTLTAEELDKFLKDHLSSYEVPKLVEFRDSLPLTMIGKPDKKALREEEKAKQAAAAKPAATNAVVAPKPKKKDGPKPS